MKKLWNNHVTSYHIPHYGQYSCIFSLISLLVQIIRDFFSQALGLGIMWHHQNDYATRVHISTFLKKMGLSLCKVSLWYDLWFRKNGRGMPSQMRGSKHPGPNLVEWKFYCNLKFQIKNWTHTYRLQLKRFSVVLGLIYFHSKYVWVYTS